MISEGEVSLKELCVVENVITNDASEKFVRFDASGCLVLPGIVDVHGDAFERQI